MRRLLYSELIRWKNKTGRKPLILLGARQVGKTWLLTEFGRNEFKDVIYINCHKDSYAPTLFKDVDATRILKDLCIHYNVKVTAGETLLIFDEIQEVRNGVASLKYFCEDHPDIHVAVAGSLLGISLREGESFPVGKVDTLKLYPMSFSEYLMALGRDALLDTIRASDWESVTSQSELLTTLLREYFFVGGMPEAVKEFIATGDTDSVRSIQGAILDAYCRDMAKHTKSMAQRINMVWESIPAQLARENKKFIFGAVRRGARAVDFEIAIQWLVDAGIAYKVNRVASPDLPLRFYVDGSAFKLYMMDCGLLACMSNASPSSMLTGNGPFVGFKGAFAENFVLQQMLVSIPGKDICYFSKDNSTQEIDFLVEKEEKLIPIEVKAEVNVKSKSLSGFVNVDHKDRNLKGVRFSMLPYKDQGWMENVPLYAVSEYFK